MPLVQIQPVSINGIEFDATIESSKKREATVPDYPIDEGYDVSDNMSLAALELEMTLYLTATPVTFDHEVGMDRVQDTIDELFKAQAARQPMAVLTTDETYENMVIQSLQVNKSQDNGYAREIPIVLKQVDIVSAKSVAVPAKKGKSGKTGSKAGATKTQTANSGTGSSTSSRTAKRNVDAQPLTAVNQLAGVVVGAIRTGTVDTSGIAGAYATALNAFGK